MGKFLPVTFACLLWTFGFSLFRPQPESHEPSLPVYIFIFTVYLLLLNVRLYPESLRTLGGCLNFFTEFFIGAFLIDYTVVSVWYLLDESVKNIPIVIGNFVKYVIESAGRECGSICETITGGTVGNVLVYIVAIFFLICALHAIRAIDLGLFECGVRAFFSDIIFRIKRNVKAFKKQIRSVRKKRSQIKGVRSGSKKRVGRRWSKLCFLGSEDYCDYDYSDVPMDKEGNYDDDTDFEMS